MNEVYLAHHGVKGQKWGVRRYQNKDGSMTREGQRRYHQGFSSKNGFIRRDFEQMNGSGIVDQFGKGMSIKTHRQMKKKMRLENPEVYEKYMSALSFGSRYGSDRRYAVKASEIFAEYTNKTLDELAKNSNKKTEKTVENTINKIKKETLNSLSKEQSDMYKAFDIDPTAGLENNPYALKYLKKS